MRARAVRFEGLHVAFHKPTPWNGKAILYVHGGPGGHAADFEEGLAAYPDFLDHGYAWITYDQRACGRSAEAPTESVSHRANVDDLVALLEGTVRRFDLAETPALYGHSYGARLVYDTLYTNPRLDASAVISGRSLHPLDAMNTSLAMDLMILRESDPSAFQVARKLAATHVGEPHELAREVRALFVDPEARWKAREKFYWFNDAALTWWNSARERSPLRDSDEVYFRVASTYDAERFNEGVFDPSFLTQRCLLIQGAFDFLMNGTANPRIARMDRFVRFNGSAHYPHFEQPRLFMETFVRFLGGCGLTSRRWEEN